MSHPFLLADVEDVFTPALVFFPQRIQNNIQAVLRMVGSPQRLRPHVKTHKTREIAQMQLAAGITKHKCATIAEAEMLAMVGAPDILIAYPLVGPNTKRLTSLAKKFPNSEFSALIDNPVSANALSAAAKEAGRSIGFYVDLDVGQHRTGIGVSEEAKALYKQASELPNLVAKGLHAYDGHNNQEAPEDRVASARNGLQPVLAMRAELEIVGLPVPAIIAGGTPSFPAYAALTDIAGLECSPGTYVLHDHGYGSRYHDLPGVEPAAVLVTRVVSKPTANRVTFDLGTKAVASDPVMAKRAQILDLPEFTIVGHNEEHLIIETPNADQFKVGDVAYALPWHICPTVALHKEVLIAEDGRITGTWSVLARDRVLSI